jgi:hypothetical protein
MTRDRRSCPWQGEDPAYPGAEQRMARDILGRVVQRRTLTPDMRELADAVRLPL